MHTLLFVDDHPLYREGMRLTLQQALPELRVLIAEDEVSASALLRAEPEIDLCLVDYRLGEHDGLSLLQKIGAGFPTIARGLLCANLTPDLIQRARQIGCVACLSKDRDAGRITEALRQLFDGGTVFDTPASSTTTDHSLSTKRLEVLRLAAAGLTNKGIGRKLGIAERSVKDHWTHIFEQLGVNTRAEAVGVAYRRNLL